MKITFALPLLALSLVPLTSTMAALKDDVAGKILLQVEESGEAWYVHPETKERHFLYRAEQAYQVMREEGVGATNADIMKIPIGYHQLSGEDSDNDGLSNTMELAIGTNIFETDSDGDSFDDKTEVINGFNPGGAGRMPIDEAFARQQAGRILLQVESRGEAWWVNPTDGKRYYLGTGQDAYELMRSTGLGVTNENLNQIPRSSKQLNCVGDYNCYIEAIEMDLPFKGMWNRQYWFLFWFDTTEDFSVTHEGDYVLETTYVEGEVFVPETEFQRLYDQGYTDQQIEEELAEVNLALQEELGNTQICVFDTKEHLKKYFTILHEEGVNLHFSADLNTGVSIMYDPDTEEAIGACSLKQ